MVAFGARDVKRLCGITTFWTPSSWPSFEDVCQALGLPLLVLPPRSPQADGIVERANRTVRVECWSRYRCELTCPAMNEVLRRYLDYYNRRRPHRSLGRKPPPSSLGWSRWLPDLKCPEGH